MIIRAWCDGSSLKGGGAGAEAGGGDGVVHAAAARWRGDVAADMIFVTGY